jgi:DNA-binding CsgD family transcriptional regulator
MMDHWWREIDEAVLQCLAVGDATPAEIGQKLGISEGGASSILAMLVVEGKVRICRAALHIQSGQ